ncbi:SWIM zinc finger family protein [Halosegnis marinus]|uniref:SWIM zinc finger family protein n=1 Tax=Halosegnis marinus TaxID=3034023 RepID=A0ABD5ZNV9_9EURY|nr:SWIM zinc finger family protein [Halosegnis sp. DT85]
MTHLEHTPASPNPKRPLAPDTSRLDPRSARAWTEPMAVRALGGGRYAVASGGDYEVDLPAGTCTCPDSGYRGERCKHLRRVAVEITRGDLAPPGRLPDACAACGREAFLPEALALCDDCRYEAGDAVRDRETGDLVVVAAVHDTPADEWLVAGTDRTVADYETNDGYPTDDPVVEVVYPFSAGRKPLADLKRYAFPHSRLADVNAQFVD